MMTMSSQRKGKAFLARLLVGAVLGQSPEEFAEQEMAILEDRLTPAAPDCPTAACIGCPDYKACSRYDFVLCSQELGGR
jgi:hypothetical protein